MYCTNKNASKEDLKSLDKRLTKEIHENRELIREHSNEIIELQTQYKSLEGLPNAILNLDKTMTAISNKFGEIDYKMDDIKQDVLDLKTENVKQNKNISTIKDSASINWIDFVTDNFWKIIVACAGMLVAVETLIK